jgi:hypothetical protein
MFKIKSLDSNCHVLNFKNKFTGAGVAYYGEDTRILWYSQTAEMDDEKSKEAIKKWVLSEGGNESGSGVSTKTQYWKEWRIPKPIKELLVKYR